MTLFVLGQPPALPAHATAIDDPRAAAGGYYLEWRDGRYFLCDVARRHQPLTIDFSAKPYSGRGGTEFLPKALRGLAGESVADATTGWAKDGWLLASRGFSLTWYERNPYLFTLLDAALTEARAHPQTAAIAARVTLIFADAATTLPPAGFTVVYLDPMYPERRKNAKVKKNMQALQQLLGESEKDEAALLARAEASATKRVIVKRPQGAPPLAGKTPSYAISAPNTRYDVYQQS